MARKTEVLIIGAGILGCFAARALSRYKLDISVIEKEADVCTGISKANTGIIYQGYDQHHGSLKAELCKRASASFSALCAELDVSYKRTGLLMLSFGPNADKVLEKKIRNAESGAIPNVHLIGPQEIYSFEPSLRDGVTHALYAEDTYVVNPWDLGIAAFENAKANGTSFYLNEEVINIRKESDSFLIETNKQTFLAKRVLCCGGLKADMLWEMVCRPMIRLIPQAADYLVFDTYCGNLIHHVLSVEPEEKGDGITIVPTADGNLLLGPTRRDIIGEFDGSTALKGLSELKKKGKWLLPDLPLEQVIRSFAAARPNPFTLDKNGEITDKSLKDFVILEEDGFFDLIGVKTPGITCANELGLHLADKIIRSFERTPELKTDFVPTRKAIPKTSELLNKNPEALSLLSPEYLEIICRCKNVSKGEILEAIKRGAFTVDGIKRRTGAGMGRCQGGYCMEKILKLLSENLDTDIYQITKDGIGSEILKKP